LLSVARWIAVVNPDGLDSIGDVMKLADARRGVILDQQPVASVSEGDERHCENREPLSPSHGQALSGTMPPKN
jgi:hypothetical protein